MSSKVTRSNLNSGPDVMMLVHKFDKALSAKKFKEGSADIFVLVDESHRTQLGLFAARMRQMWGESEEVRQTRSQLLVAAPA